MAGAGRQKSELDNRLTIIDWVRDTINAPAEELGPEQLAQRAVESAVQRRLRQRDLPYLER